MNDTENAGLNPLESEEATQDDDALPGDAEAAENGDDAADGGTEPDAEGDDNAPTPAALPEDHNPRDLPAYRSHKLVRAFRIDEQISLANGQRKLIQRDDSGDVLYEAVVDGAYIDKHKPRTGGYFVQYADNYKSWSPAEAFEDGYTRV